MTDIIDMFDQLTVVLASGISIDDINVIVFGLPIFHDKIEIVQIS